MAVGLAAGLLLLGLLFYVMLRRNRSRVFLLDFECFTPPERYTFCHLQAIVLVDTWLSVGALNSVWNLVISMAMVSDNSRD